MYTINFVYHITQQIAVDHAVLHTFENRRDNIPAIASVFTLQATQVGEQPDPTSSIRANGFIIIDKRDQLITGDAARYGSPVTPTVWRLDRWLEFLTF